MHKYNSKRIITVMELTRALPIFAIFAAFCVTPGFAGGQKAVSASADNGSWQFVGLASPARQSAMDSLSAMASGSSLADSAEVTADSVETPDLDKAMVTVAYGAKSDSVHTIPFNGMTGRALFDALNRYVNTGVKAWSYNQAKSFMYGQADNIAWRGARGIVTAYSQIFVAGTSSNGSTYKEQGDVNGDGYIDSNGINAEHSWPQSFFREALPMKSDIHHLQSTFVTPNGRRGAFPYGMVSGAVKYATNSGSRLGGQSVFEPCDANKGNTARAMLYFMLRYHDRNIRNGGFSSAFWTQKVDTLLLWNRMDPPDENEMRRNELIYKYQGNRNPFIDDYTFADRIGAQVWKMF